MITSQTSWTYDNLVVPVGGVGQRFTDAGFEVPKPLITVGVLTQLQISILSALKSFPFRNVTIGCRSGIHGLVTKMVSEHKWGSTIVQVVDIGAHSLGAADTVSRIISNSNFGSKSFWVVDSDTYLRFEDQSLPPEENSVCVGVGESANPSYSYVDMDKEFRFTRIVEKQVISNFAVCGIYGFKSSALYQQAFNQVISIEQQSELFLSKVVQQIVNNGSGVAMKASEWVPIGTPSEISELNKDQLSKMNRLDLDI